jgi:hypothetical protein
MGSAAIMIKTPEMFDEIIRPGAAPQRFGQSALVSLADEVGKIWS